MCPPCSAQNEKASINSSIAKDGTGRIVVEARGQLPQVPLVFTAKSDTTAKVSKRFIEQDVQLSIQIIQGDARTVSVGLRGAASVRAVDGDQIESWSVRQVGPNRFLDLKLKEDRQRSEGTRKAAIGLFQVAYKGRTNAFSAWR